MRKKPKNQAKHIRTAPDILEEDELAACKLDSTNKDDPNGKILIFYLLINIIL